MSSDGALTVLATTAVAAKDTHEIAAVPRMLTQVEGRFGARLLRRPNAPDERGWVNGDHAVWCRIGELSGVDGDLGVTSIYLQGIDSHEIISTVHARPALVIPATAGLRNRR